MITPASRRHGGQFKLALQQRIDAESRNERVHPRVFRKKRVFSSV
jgi:hypothetical protein